jgi:hypothetical protein
LIQASGKEYQDDINAQKNLNIILNSGTTDDDIQATIDELLKNDAASKDLALANVNPSDFMNFKSGIEKIKQYSQNPDEKLYSKLSPELKELLKNYSIIHYSL